MFPEWTVIVGFFLGATIGSFLNMAIYRLPRKISFVDPAKSMCPACKHSLGALDLFPLLSWLMLRGKCRYCQAPVSARYFYVELLTGGLWAALWWQSFIAAAVPAQGIAFMALSATLVAVTFIDWETFEIPDELNLVIALIAVGYAWATHGWEIALYGWFWGWAVLWGIALLGRIAFRKDAMGHGDIKLMRCVGAVIGPWMIAPTMMIAVISGLVIGVTLKFIVKRPPEEAPESEVGDYEPETFASLFLLGGFYLLGLDLIGVFAPGIYRPLERMLPNDDLEDEDWNPSWTHIPFGPYLALGAIICMVFYRPIERGIESYLRTMRGDNISHGVEHRGENGFVLRWAASTIDENMRQPEHDARVNGHKGEGFKGHL